MLPNTCSVQTFIWNEKETGLLLIWKRKSNTKSTLLFTIVTLSTHTSAENLLTADACNAHVQFHTPAGGYKNFHFEALFTQELSLETLVVFFLVFIGVAEQQKTNYTNLL